jgi:RNA polymerase sigma-70 factor, ECF subfamily
MARAKLAQSPDSDTAVVERHWTAVYRMLYAMTRNVHDCEDLTQETFLRALRRWETFKPGTSLRAWLLRIAANAFFDVKRKQKTLKIAPLQVDLSSEAPPVEMALELREQGLLARAAMEELSELTRMVFHLRVTEDLAFKEIAELAGITPVAARWHMHQARVKLMKRLGLPCGVDVARRHDLN